MDQQFYSSNDISSDPNDSDNFEKKLKKLFKYSGLVGALCMIFTGVFKAVALNEDLFFPAFKRIYHTAKQLADIPDPEPVVASIDEPSPKSLEGETRASPNKKREWRPSVDNSSRLKIEHYYTYTVRRGETLEFIANVHDMTLDDVLDLNPDIDDPNLIKSGVTKLKVKAWKLHRVRKGEIFRKVAKIFGIRKGYLMQANGRRKDRTTRGEILIIHYNGRR